MKSSFSIIRFSNNDFQRKGNCATHRLSKKSFVGFHMARDFVARGRPLRGQKRLAPLAKRSTCSKSMQHRALRSLQIKVFIGCIGQVVEHILQFAQFLC